MNNLNYNDIPELSSHLKFTLLKVQSEILELLANQHPLDEIIAKLIIQAESFLEGDAMGCIMLRESKETLGKPIGPSLPTQYMNNISTVKIGIFEGSCGKAAYTKKLVVVKDIASDPLWEKYKMYALPYGLRACWTIPIMMTNEVIGTFGIYYKEAKAPSKIDIKIIESFTKVLTVILKMRKNENALFESEKKHRNIADNISDCVSVIDSKGKISYASLSHEKALGYTPSELIGLNSLKFIHPEDRKSVQKIIFLLFNTKEDQHIKFRIKHKNGYFLTWESKGMVVVEGDTSVDKCVIISRDITEQEQLSKTNEESKLRYQSLFSQNLDAIISLDLQGMINEPNPAALKITKYSKDELKKMHFINLLPKEQYEKADTMFKGVLSGEHQKDEFLIKDKYGNNVIVIVTAMPIYVNKTISGVYIIAKDITKQKEAESQILFMAYHDQLTNLPNRHKINVDLEELLSSAIAQNLSFSILYIDLDGFKEVNDLIGHRNGDILLREVSSRLLKIKDTDSTVYRIGGDEFIVIVPNSTVRQAETLAKKYIEDVSQPIKLLEHEFIVTPSIGISNFPLHGKDIDILIQKADKAMYASKNREKGSFAVFNDDSLSNKWNKVQLRSHLNKAIKNNELLLYFQPKICLSSNEMGLEVLLRWNHPELGIIPPLAFIPIAEEYGLITEITYWVIEESLIQLKQLSSFPFNISHISINFSAYQMENDQNIIKNIQNLIMKYNIDPSFIELEMTESTLMKNTNQNINILKQLKQLGIRLALDDFGVNYSSLNYIKYFPIDRIKIDRSFIKEVTTDRKDSSLVDFIISLSHKLDLLVTAEGVENYEQIQWLMERGCNELQGFYFSKPLPLNELIQHATDIENIISSLKKENLG